MTKLSSRWQKWRRTRRAELIASGMAPGVAADWARLEAEGRSRIATMTGLCVAQNANLVFIGERAFVVGDLEKVPPARRPLVDKLSRQAIESIS